MNIRNIFILQLCKGLLCLFTIILVTAVESWQILNLGAKNHIQLNHYCLFELSVQEVNTNQIRLNFPDDSHLKCNIKQILLNPTDDLRLNTRSNIIMGVCPSPTLNSPSQTMIDLKGRERKEM